MAIEQLKMFTLISGAEVIAKVIHEVDPTYPDAFVVKQAVVTRLIKRGPDSYGIELHPYSPSNVDGEHRFYKQAIASEAVGVPHDVANVYLQQTSTIEVVSTPRIQLQ